MPKRHLSLLVGFGLIALLVLSCSRDTGTDSPAELHVAGRVLAYSCGSALGAPEGGLHWEQVGSSYDGLYSDTQPFSAATGLSAEIEFTGENGEVTILETDELSTFGLSLPKGLYSIKIETDRTRPDYFDSVLLTTDTIIDLVIRYDYSTADLIYLAFCYDEGGDIPLGPEGERAVLDELNDSLGGLLLLDEAQRSTSICVLYRVPTLPERRLWEVVMALRLRLEFAGPHPALRFSVPGYGLCPEDFTVFDSLDIGPGDGDTIWFDGDGWW